MTLKNNIYFNFFHHSIVSLKIFPLQRIKIAVCFFFFFFAIKATLSLPGGFCDEVLFHGGGWSISAALDKQNQALCSLHSY